MSTYPNIFVAIWILIAISEGIKISDGRYVSELTDNVGFIDAFGHRMLSGTAKFLANKIAEKYGCKTRAVELSTLQRCSSHIVSRVDITEAFQVGGDYVTSEFINYVKPLIQSELTPVMVDGLPRHLTLNDKMLKTV